MKKQEGRSGPTLSNLPPSVSLFRSWHRLLLVVEHEVQKRLEGSPRVSV